MKITELGIVLQKSKNFKSYFSVLAGPIETDIACREAIQM